MLQPRRVLLIQDRRFGDVVLTTALLEDMAAAWPDAALDFLVGAPAAPMLAHHPHITDIVILERRNVLRMWRSIRRRGYDVVIDVQGNPRTAMITLASGAPVRIGWPVRGYAWVYTHRVPRQRNAHYVVRDRQRLLHAAGVPPTDAQPRLHLTAAERAEGERTLLSLAAGAARERRVGLQLATAEPAKNWPIPSFVELSQRLHSEGLSPIIFGGPADAAHIAEFLQAGGAGVVAPRTQLRGFMAMLANCGAFISGDTGPAHMATALDVPRITLYGPTDPRGWDPGRSDTIALRDESIRCTGCFVHRCVHDQACMKALTPALVLDATLRLLRQLGA